MSSKQRSLGDVLQEFAAQRRAMQQELQKVIVGQEEVIEQVFAAVFTRGHCLLEGVPGLAKTLLVSTLAQILDIPLANLFRIKVASASLTRIEWVEQGEDFPGQLVFHGRKELGE